MIVTRKIIEFLDNNEVNYKVINHIPTFTSKDSALARNENLNIGGKALVIKLDHDFKLFVLSAASKLDTKSIKKYFSVKDIRFATIAELYNLTGLVPGSVPPFGKPILNLGLIVDESVLRNQSIGFNAGSLTMSIVMDTKDYLQISNPNKISNFSK